MKFILGIPSICFLRWYESLFRTFFYKKCPQEGHLSSWFILFSQFPYCLLSDANNLLTTFLYFSIKYLDCDTIPHIVYTTLFQISIDSSMNYSENLWIFKLLVVIILLPSDSQLKHPSPVLNKWGNKNKGEMYSIRRVWYTCGTY